MSFKDLGLQPSFTAKCEQMGFTEPTPIQKRAIPIIIKGGDVIGIAETGTGKTAAFLLPILQKISENKERGISVLVLAPTRELAIQIELECRRFAPRGVSCAAIIGGSSYGKQIGALEKGVNILIATPGRLIDLMDRKLVNFSRLRTLILDEADRMLDMGFLPAIKRIVESIPTERQTLFFSATMPYEVERIANRILKDPTQIEVSRSKAAVTIEQLAYPVAQQHKMPLLLNLLEDDGLDKVLVFTRTKRGADRLAHVLKMRSFRMSLIHGDRSQSQRESALKAFKNGKARILVATDVAARGIDIESVSHVINYDVPSVPEDYVHRIGRTGRAGSTGIAITLLTSAEEHSMRDIERLTGNSVERILLPDFGGVELAPVHVAQKAAPSRRFRSYGGRRRW
jgi:ATP-dependent RNA helicase RhlE